MDLKKHIQQTFAIDIIDDIFYVIYSYLFNEKLEISIIDSYVISNDNKINIYDENNKILQTIDFDQYDNIIHDDFDKNQKNIDNDIEKDRNTKKKDFKLEEIIYSKENGHIWLIYNDYISKSMLLYYTYLTYNSLRFGELCYNLPLIKIDNKTKIAIYSHFDCTSNGDLFYIDNDSGDQKICSMNISQIEISNDDIDDNKTDIILTKTVKFNKYKLNKNTRRVKPVCHSGMELNKLFRNIIENKFDENVYYLGYFIQKGSNLSIFIYDYDSGKLIYKFIDKNIKNYQYELKLKEQEKILQVSYKFDCDNGRIMIIGEVAREWYTYDIYALYVYLLNDDEILIKNLKKIGNIYGEGGFYVESILESINDEYYIWFKVNGRGIGYNHTKYIALNKSDLTINDSKEEYCYKYPVDKKMGIRFVIDGK